MGDALRVGLWRMIPVVGVAILVGLVLALAVIPVVLGSLLGIEPLGVLLAGVWGLLVMTVLWVAVPVAVVERPGIVASLRRSAALTSGYRWKVFAIIILLALINILVAMVVGVVAVGALSVALGFYGVIIGQYVANVVVSGIGAVMPAVAYHDLRTVKEGTDIDRLAAVFD